MVQYQQLKIEASEETLLLEKLEREIILNPEAKHRIILKAIKTTKSRATQKAIREYFKKEFRNR